MAAVSVAWKWLALFFILVSTGLLIGLIVVATKDRSFQEIKKTDKMCGAAENVDTKISTSPGLFDDLTPDEMQKIYDYLFGIKSLNLTSNKKSKSNSNTIAVIRLYPPSKDEALAYLDEGKAKPERQAIVVIFKGAAKPPIIEEYIVGPANAPSKLFKHQVKGRSYPIDFNSRPGWSPQEETDLLNFVVMPMFTKLHQIFKESYDGYTFVNCTDRCLTYIFQAPFGRTSATRENWYIIFRDDIRFNLHALNFEFYVDRTSFEPSEWRVTKLLYNDQLFNSTEELLDAYENGKLAKTFIPAPQGKDKIFSTYERRGKQQPSKPSRGPEQYEPDGKRYSVKGRHIEYMNWAFDFRVDTVSGQQVYDVRFGGERIAYEISLQEAASAYTGYYPVQKGNHYLDSTYMMGAQVHDLLQGTDCPGTATYFDLAHMYYSDKPSVIKNAACVFELNTGIPLRRHFGSDFVGGYKFYGSMVNQALVLRTIPTIGNYDYIHDYIFYQNGAIEIKVHSSGYVFGTFYDQNVASYAYPIHANISSTTHDHFFNYKVDLDVGGRQNSYETIEVEVENVTEKWTPETYPYFIRKVLKRTTKKTEQEAAYKFNFDRPKYLNFYNEKKKNMMGTKKGYRIQLNGILKQLYPEDWAMVPMISWSLYQMAVTRHKDSERSSSSLYNQNAPTDPHIDFRKFLSDNESIVNQDLVAWVTTGMLHIPHSEDVPNTATVGSGAGFLLRPFNYFDEDPSMGSTNAVLIKPTDKNNRPSFERYGTPTGSVCPPKDYPVSFDGTY